MGAEFFKGDMLIRILKAILAGHLGEQSIFLLYILGVEGFQVKHGHNLLCGM